MCLNALIDQASSDIELSAANSKEWENLYHMSGNDICNLSEIPGP